MKKSIELLKDKLQAKLQGKIKYFYIGDPVLIPESAMPCIAISPNQTESTVADNSRDKHTHRITVAVIINAKTFFGATPEKMVGSTYLMDIMGGEDSDTTVNDNTILGVLRNNLNLDTNRWISNVSTIDYATRRRAEDLITLEAIASIDIEQIVNR